jgi:hypothetical protein
MVTIIDDRNDGSRHPSSTPRAAQRGGKTVTAGRTPVAHDHHTHLPRVACSPALRKERSHPASEVMKPSDLAETVLRLAAAAYLGRYSGVSLTHSESDLQTFFTWWGQRDLAPLAARRAQIEL